jgi:hypothetical protein
MKTPRTKTLAWHLLVTDSTRAGLQAKESRLAPLASIRKVSANAALPLTDKIS